MSVVLLGLSHKTAPIELRELFAIAEKRLPDALAQLLAHEPLSGGLIISTCNRVEVIASTAQPTDAAVSALNNFVRDFHGFKPEDIDRHTYIHSELDAVRHIFRVTASLDSMVVGEPQITGQVKDAFQKAQQAGTVGNELNRVMSRAFAVAKRVRNETAIGQNAVSISYVAVELARKVFDRLDGSTVMLVGAGEMSELAARHLKNVGASRLLVANRTVENADRLASEMGGEALQFTDFEKRLHEADIVICSTEASHYLIGSDAVRHALLARRNQPILFIDISVPRNIDPAISNLDNVFLFDVDDLENVVNVNRTEREREALRAEAIVDSEVRRFAASIVEGDINYIIGEFRREVGLMVELELERSRKRLGPLTSGQEEAVRTLVDSIVSKLTLPVIKQLRESDEGYSGYIEEWRELFRKSQSQQSMKDR